MKPGGPSLASLMDGTMCAMMNALHWRLRSHVCSRHDLEKYLERCSRLTREEFYAASPVELGAPPAGGFFEWRSPVESAFPANDLVRMRWFPGPHGVSAPTVLLLHALMSARDAGYARLARWFNERGWNAIFPHLPFHYSRKPAGFFNGELAITANLVRNAETLRQSVVELRQIMAWLRKHNCPEFAIVGTSYGGWNGALVSFLEADLRFLALIQPIVDIEHAIWESPGSVSMRRALRRQGIEPGESRRHAHLTSPLDGTPLCGGERIILTAGAYDSVSPKKSLVALADRWSTLPLLTVNQGHFGYVALARTLKEITSFL